MPLLDAHTHLDLYPAEHQADIVAEIHDRRITILANSVDLASYRQTVELAAGSPLIIPGLGIHPWYAAEQLHTLPKFEPLLADAPFIGEIGLDFLWVKDRSQDDAQRTVFDYFLKAAKTHDKWVNLHTKDAEAEILARLRQNDIRKAIVHWYSGPVDIFEQMVDEGYLFTIGAAVLNDPLIEQFATALPLSQLLTETDGPSGMQWITGEIGRPSDLVAIIDKIATLRGVSPEHIIEAVWANGHNLNLF